MTRKCVVESDGNGKTYAHQLTLENKATSPLSSTAALCILCLCSEDLSNDRNPFTQRHALLFQSISSRCCFDIFLLFIDIIFDYNVFSDVTFCGFCQMFVKVIFCDAALVKSSGF